MLRGFTFLQVASMGLLRETGSHLACKGMISNKNLDKVSFWPHWQRFYDSTLIVFFFFLHLPWQEGDAYFFKAYLRSTLKFCLAQRWWKFTQQWCVFTVLLIPKDTSNLIFSCIKLHHKTYSEFERLLNAAPPESKLENVMSLSKTCWWVQSGQVQCHNN